MKTIKALKSIFTLVLIYFTFCSCSSNEPDKKPDENPTSEAQKDVALMDNAVQSFMSKYNIPGLSLALTKDEKLIYLKAYGHADKENGETLTSEHRFRIASVSKPITGILITKMIEDGLLSMEDFVFGQGAILGTKFGTSPYSENLKKIKVKHLLNHTAGAWGNSNNDPMFLHPTYTKTELINWTLNNRPVTNTPGNVYDYSNFGYCLLGMIVEEITKKDYVTYTKNSLFTPLGIDQIDLGGNTLADKKSNEVKYYGTSVGGANPYSFNLSRMDAHGGWIANAKDLAKILVRVDGKASKTDILKPASISTMTTAPSISGTNYTSGWSVNSNGNWWHTGSLPGTRSIWVRANMGYNWVILTNSRSGDDEAIAMDELMWSVILNSSAQWQNIDQF